MSVRRISLTLFSIVFFVFLYLSYGDDESESKGAASNQTNEMTDNSSRLSSKTSLSSKVDPLSSEVKENNDFGAFECLSQFSFDEEAIRESASLYLQSLSDSFSEADPLYYALYANPPEGKSRLDLLLDYDNKFPSNPIVSMDLISLCVNSPDKRCSIDFINDAILSDKKNGAIWLGAVSYYAAKGNDAGVIDSIDALEKTSLFNERFGEKILQYAQALEGTTSSHFNMNAIAGIGKATSNLLAYSPITQWCEKVVSQPSKASACLTLGEQLESRSTTLISKTIGIGLQDIVYKSQGNDEAVQLNEAKRKELTESPINKQYHKASIMLMLDERLLRSWLNNIDFYGEYKSQYLLVEEAEALYEKNDNFLCTLIYELLDGFT